MAKQSQAKRYILVPEEAASNKNPNFLERREILKTPPETKKMLALDIKMNEILNNDKLNEQEKAEQYATALQLYLKFGEQVQQQQAGETSSTFLQPSSTKGASSKETESVDQNENIIKNQEENNSEKFRTQVENIVAKRYRNQVLKLAEYIKPFESLISWDETSGEVAINHEIIPNSNIIDLLRSTITPRMKIWDTIGGIKFINALSKINFPVTLIPNKESQDLLIKVKKLAPEPRRQKTKKRLQKPNIAWSKLYNK